MRCVYQTSRCFIFSINLSLSHFTLPLSFQTAFEVLEGLLHEDDEVVGVWYLMGWLHHLTGDADSARFYLEQTQTVRELE